MDKTARHYRLAFVVSMYFEYGGMQRTLLRIARECAARGHAVHLFTGEWRGARPAGITVHEVDTAALTNHGSNRRLAVYLGEAITRQGFDCITGFTKLPGLDVYYAGDPCFKARLNGKRNSLFRLLPRYRELGRQEAAVFAADGNTEILLINHPEREKFIRYYRTPAERFHLLPPGIARDRMAGEDSAAVRADFRSEYHLRDDERLLLLVGSNFSLKGLDRALHAVHDLPAEIRQQVRLFAVGADRAARFERLAARLGLDRQFRVFPGRDDIYRFLAGADLLLHPARKENTGTVILEAIVAGLPVLVSAACGFSRHVIESGAGQVIAEPFEQQQMSRQLESMLTASRLSEWSSNGIEYGRSHDLYSLIDRAADAVISRARRNRA